MNKKLMIFLVISSCIMLFASGCAKDVKRCAGGEDNSQHHYVVGMKLLEEGKVDEAKAKFDRAKYCDEKFSPAYSGLAIFNAEKSKTQKDKDFKVTVIKRAFTNLEKADDLAESDNDKFIYQVAKVRVNTAVKENITKSEEAYKEAKDLEKVDEKKLDYYLGKEANDYFMGLAYMGALEFRKAEDRLKAVMDARREGKWQTKADKVWQKVQKIVRAMAGITVGNVGKKIAIKESITRGDLSALLVDELKIDKFFAGRIPIKSKLKKMKAEFVPADTTNHHFKTEILTILKWKVRGLEPIYDATTKASLFKADVVVKRLEMAFILEDVLIKLIDRDGVKKLAIKFIGAETSPYPDVKKTSFYFNAVMNMVTRGIMKADLSGEFRPMDAVTGADALLALRVLKQTMNIH